MMIRAFATGVTVILAAISIGAQSGGGYAITSSVVASGGASSVNDTVTAVGTVGQSAAGTSSDGGQFNITGGFWAADAFVPTAANANIAGRVLNANGGGILNVVVTLTDESGVSRRTLSSNFGYFEFDDLPSGSSYVVSVNSKHFTFGQPSRIFSLNDSITDANFIAEP